MTRMRTITVAEIVTEATEFWRHIIERTSNQLLEQLLQENSGITGKG
jgi:hypothetical protein